MTAFIVSLKFNPGHFSHLVANYKLFEKLGFTSVLYVNKKFNEMDEANEFKKMNSSKEIKEFKKIDYTIFWFPSLQNLIEIIRLKYIYKSKIGYVYHEPFDSIQNYYNSGFRFKKILKICLIHLINIPVLLLSDRVILPSRSSYNLYKKKFTFLNKNFTWMDLIFDDEAEGVIDPQAKKYISYIGTVAADHAFDRFIDFVCEAVQQNWFPSMKYLIATSSVLSEDHIIQLAPAIACSRIEIKAGAPLKNSEINQCYKDSQVIWNAYNRSMQSGVLPKAFMFGTPAILLHSNANDYLDNHVTGVLIHNNSDLIEIKCAVDEILANREMFFVNCRRKFLEKFYYKNKINDFLAFIK